MRTQKLIQKVFSEEFRPWLARAFSGLVMLGTATACLTNNGSPLSYSPIAVSSSTATTSAGTFNISNVVIVSPNASPTPTASTGASIFFNTTTSTGPINSVCNQNTDSTAEPCACQFSWQQVNQNSGNPIQIPRTVQTAITTLQANLVVCSLPDVFSTEIPSGTTVNISVVPQTGNTYAFSVPAYAYTVNTTGSTGSYQDYLGNSYQNIVRYACYEYYLHGMGIQSQNLVQTDPGGTTVAAGQTLNIPYASRFCVATANNANASQSQGCSTLPPNDYSSQSSYYNLYIPQYEIGDINLSNARYICPQVQEPLAGAAGVGSQGLPYPLDSTFSLAMSPTVQFAVGVDAFTSLSNGNDPVSSGSGSCYPNPAASGTATTTSGTSSSNSGFNLGCLGYAALPNSDGSCPYIRNSAGQIVYTYRLRRYVALYPPEFDADGTAYAQAPTIDTIYVEDRPVNSPNANPLKPYTMAGPKPCPFSYFDRASVATQTITTDPVTGGPSNYSGNYYDAANGAPFYPNGDGFAPGYVGTANAAWTGKNVDGIQFPYWDGVKNGVNGCSAAMPVPNAAKTVVSIATVNATLQPKAEFKHLFVRPILSWNPHYVEDTSFQACAPPSSNFQDPPLHFMRDTKGNVSYCAEAYPTQNPNINYLDNRYSPTTPYYGMVRNYTSHARKGTLQTPNTNTGPQCAYTPITTVTAATYPAAGQANHPATSFIDRDNSVLNTAAPGNEIAATKTCDRTVITPGLQWGKFPLLSNAPDTETALANDSTYNCTVTYDNNSGKAGISTPSGGCCGANVLVQTGLNSTTPTAAHLEPSNPCLIPSY